MSSQREKRPWLAAFLGTLATGLGHFYLRRWKRGLGWFAAAVATSVLFVPPEAARTLLDGGGDPATLAPVLIVGVPESASRHRAAGDQSSSAPSSASSVSTCSSNFDLPSSVSW